MGGAQSLPAATSADTKTILNFILREMFRRADLVDMYSLADPERCKRYIVFAADSLDKIFGAQRITPTAGKGGTLYFQSIDGLVKGMPKEVRDQQTYNCRKLAFFFIRIFQIFGALSLSILDSDLPSVDPVDAVNAKERPTRGTVFHAPPGLTGFSGGLPAAKPRGLLGGLFQRGGAITRTGPGHRTYYIDAPSGAEDYRILNKYLTVPSGGTAATDDLFFERSQIRVRQETLYDNVGADTRRVKAAPAPLLTYPFKDAGRPNRVTAVMRIAPEGLDVRVSLSDIRVGAEPAAPPTAEFILTKQYPDNSAPEDSAGRQLPEVLEAKFKEIVERKLGFSAIQWLRDMRYIDSTEQNNINIRGTRITIDRPTDQYRAPKVTITYSDSAKVDGKTRDVRLQTTMELRRSVDPLGKLTYAVRIEHRGMKVTPETLKEDLEFHDKEYREQRFFASSATAEPTSDKGEKMPTWMQSVFDDLLKAAKTGEGVAGHEQGGLKYTREGVPIPVNTSHMEERFKVKRLWQALTRTPPIKAHCVARAMQLLNVAAIASATTKEGYSSICRVKFPLVKDGSLPNPEAEKSLLESEGIRALAILFVDTLEAAVPRISEKPKYAEFLRKLKQYFERIDDLSAVTQPDSFDDIGESVMPLCRGHIEQRIKVQGAALGQLRAKARELLQRQAKHVRGVMSLLFELFNEQKVRAGILELNPRIIEGGMEAVNAVGVKARELLIEYYGDCERTYKDGLYVLQNNAAALSFMDAAGAPVVAPTGPSAAEANA